MGTIHTLPTEKPSRLIKNNLGLAINEDFTQSILDLIQAKFVNINITSNKKPQKGCYYICNNIVKKCNWLASANGLIYLVDDLGNQDVIDFCKKIILTTDQDLIADGVQAIDDEFLEWFVNNSNCEEVGVELEIGSLRWSNSKNTYKIIFPKEVDMLELGQIIPKEEQNKKLYSEEEFLEFSEWVSDNDWVYLPIKSYWVNEEQEELEQKFTTKQLFEKFKNK